MKRQKPPVWMLQGFPSYGAWLDAGKPSLEERPAKPKFAGLLEKKENPEPLPKPAPPVETPSQRARAYAVKVKAFLDAGMPVKEALRRANSGLPSYVSVPDRKLALKRAGIKVEPIPQGMRKVRDQYPEGRTGIPPGTPLPIKSVVKARRMLRGLKRKPKSRGRA